MERPASDEHGPDDDKGPDRAETRIAAIGGVLGGLVFYAHARLVGGASEDHIGFQIFWGIGVGFMIPSLVFTAISDYHKAQATSDRYDSFWRWMFRSVNGVAFIVIELFFIGFLIWVLVDPNGSASLPAG